MKFTLPMPPSGNHRVKITRTGAYKTPEYQAFQEQVGWLLRAAGVTPLEGPVRVHIDIFYKRNIDVDNVMKGVFDSAQGYLYLNDAQITDGSFHKEQDKLNPRVEVTVEAK